MKDQFHEVVTEAERLLIENGAIRYGDPDLGLNLYAEAMAIVMQDHAKDLERLANSDKLAHAISMRQGNLQGAPKKRGPTPARYALRDRQIIMTVFRLTQKFGIGASRNPFSPPTSACDAVSEAYLRLYRRGDVPKALSYEYVLELWKQRPGFGSK